MKAAAVLLGVSLWTMGHVGCAWAADELAPTQAGGWQTDDLWMGLLGAGLVLLARLARSGRLGRWAADI